MRKLIGLCIFVCLLVWSKPSHAAMVHSAEVSTWRNLDLEEDILQINVTEPSGLSAAQFNQLLKDTALEGYGDAFYQMEERHGTNGVFAIAVAMLEYGIERRAPDHKNNYFGLTYGGERIEYASVEDNIMAFGALVQKPVYRNKPFLRFAKIYCPPRTDFWVKVVRNKYRKLAIQANSEEYRDMFRIMLAFKMEASECL